MNFNDQSKVKLYRERIFGMAFYASYKTCGYLYESTFVSKGFYEKQDDLGASQQSVQF